MILKTSVTPSVPIVDKEVSGFMFEDSSHVQSFIESIDLFLKGKNEYESNVFYLMDQEYQEINKKEVYPILLDCGKVDLSIEKSFKDSTLSYFENMIYENMEINHKFHKLQVAIDELVNGLEMKKPNYTVELEGQSFDVKKLLKLITVDIHNGGNQLNHFELRECFYDIVAKMNKENKRVILFVLYPETNLGIKDIDKFMKWLQRLNITVILVSNNFNILKNLKLNNVNFVKKNREIYDLIRLVNELELFEMRDFDYWESQVIQLSYFDFTGNRLLVNSLYNEFLFD